MKDNVTPAVDLERERASFEAWARENYFATGRYTGYTGKYSAPLTQAAWQAWLARARSGDGVDTARLDWLLLHIGENELRDTLLPHYRIGSNESQARIALDKAIKASYSGTGAPP